LLFSIEDPIFQPARRIITGITQANPAVVTTSFDHDYFTDDIVRIILPNSFGMPQLHKQKGKITVLSSTTFSIDIDTSLYDSFTAAAVLLNDEPFIPPVPLRIITEITQANPAAVTTEDAHNLSNGDTVTLQVPQTYGMTQVNGKSGTVTVTGTTTFTVTINTTSFSEFSVPTPNQCAQVIPVGEATSTLYGATENTLPTRVR